MLCMSEASCLQTQFVHKGTQGKALFETGGVTLIGQATGIHAESADINGDA